MEIILMFASFIFGVAFAIILMPVIRVKRWAKVTVTETDVTFESNCNWDGDTYEIYKDGVIVGSGKVKGGVWK